MKASPTGEAFDVRFEPDPRTCVDGTGGEPLVGRADIEHAPHRPPVGLGLLRGGADDAHNGAQVICGAVRKAPHMATMDVSGRLKVCRASAGSTRCLGNVGEGAFVLGYGKSVTVGRFRCFSLRTGMKCIVISSGRGFLINRSGVSRVVP